MKNKTPLLHCLTALLILITGICFSSCTEKTKEALSSAVVLTKKTELCLYGRDNEMHPILSLSAGDTVKAVKINGNFDVKTDYIHVVHNSLDFWTMTDGLALDSQNAILIEETAIFSDAGLTQPVEQQTSARSYDSAKESAASNAVILKSGTLIALSLEKQAISEKKHAVEAAAEPDDSPDSINTSDSAVPAKIYYFDADSKKICQAFCPADSVSTSEDDIAVTQIIEALKVTARAVPRNELFIKASKYNPSPKVLAALNAQKTEKQTYSYQKALKSMKNMRYQVHVDELMTVDQSKDPFK